MNQLGGWKWSARLSEGQTTGEGAFVEHRAEHSAFPMTLQLRFKVAGGATATSFGCTLKGDF